VLKCSYDKTSNNDNSKERKQKKSLRGDGYVFGTDCGDDFMDIYYLQTHQIVHYKYCQLFVGPSYLNKVVLKMPATCGMMRVTNVI
jgi:hypothetical protein